MNIQYHLVGTELTELQNFRLHNVASLTTSASTAKGLVRYRTSDDTAHLHIGSNSWRQFFLHGDSLNLASLALPNGQLYVGNGSGNPAATAKSSIRLNEWGQPLANVNLGGTYTITGVPDPTGDTDAANKRYVDNAIQGLDAKASCWLATNQALPACTYHSGNLTLTASANGELTVGLVDSTASSVDPTPTITLSVGQRLLIKNQVTKEHNGIYEIVALGSAYAAWQLVRTGDANTNPELRGAFTFIERGTYGTVGFTQTSDDYDITNPSTKEIVWVQFSQAGAVTAGFGLIQNGTTLHFARSSAYAHGTLFFGSTGGTGEEATSKLKTLEVGTAGKLLRSSGSEPAWSTLTIPDTIAVKSVLGANSANTVTAITAGANNTLFRCNNSGTLEWSNQLPQGTTLNGETIYTSSTVAAMTAGGTGVNLTGNAGAVVYIASASTMGQSAVGTTGYFLRSGGTGAPTWLDLFGSGNTWTGLQTYQTTATSSALTVQTAPASSGSYVDAPYVHWRGNGNNAGTVTYASWYADVTVSDTAGNSYFRLSNAKYTGSPTLSTKLVLSDTGVLSLTGTSVVLNTATANYVTLAFNNTPSASKTFQLPTSSSTETMVLATINGGQTFTSATWNGSAIGLQYGGTGASLSGATDGSVVYKSGTAFTAVAPSNGRFLQSGASAVSWFDLFGTSNTWTAAQTVQTSAESDGWLVSSPAAGNNSWASSSVVRWRGTGNNSGSVTNVDWRAYSDVTSIAGVSTWVLEHSATTGAPSYTKRFEIGAAAVFSILGTGSIDTSSNLKLNGTSVVLNQGAASTGTLQYSTLSAARTWTLPDVTGTVCLTNAGQTLTSATWNGSVIALAYGGTGKALTASAGGIIWSDADSLEVLAGVAADRRLLWSGNAATPAWSPYAFPATVTANNLFVTSSSSVVTALVPTNNRLLATDGSGNVTWGGILGVARNTAGGIARKYSQRYQGTGVAYIDVTHSLGTTDVVVQVRKSNSSDDGLVGTYDLAWTLIQVTNSNTVRVHFVTNQTSSDYWSVTVIG